MIQSRLIIAGVILALVAATGGVGYLYVQTRVERDLAKSETKVVEQGYRAAIDHWQEDAQEKAKQIEVLNDGYADARAEQAIAEKYLAEHNLSKAITEKPDLVVPLFNRMVAGLLNDISDATARHSGSASHIKASKAGRAGSDAP